MSGPQPSRNGAALAPSGAQYEISCGEQRAVVVEVGGGLRVYSVGGRDLLDGYGLHSCALRAGARC